MLDLEIKSDCGGGVCQELTVADDFYVESFSANDGPDSWAGDWIEHDPASGGAGPWGGQVFVNSGFLQLQDYAYDGVQPSAAREVDLSGASSAVLDFDYWASGGEISVAVEVSADGGATWTTIENITNHSGWGWSTLDISGFASSETQVRYRVTSDQGGLFAVDWVEVRTTCP